MRDGIGFAAVLDGMQGQRRSVDAVRRRSAGASVRAMCGLAPGLLVVGMAAVSASAQILRHAIRAAAGRCVVVLLPILLAAGISGTAAAQSMLTLTSSGTTQVFPI